MSAVNDGGVFATGAGTSFHVEDVTIMDVGAGEEGFFGRCVTSQLGATVEASRIIAERCTDHGFFAAGEGTVLTVEDARITDVASRAADGRYGRGVNVQDGAHAMLMRVTVQSVRDVGVAVIGTGAQLVGSDVGVVDTAQSGCAQSSCADSPGGFGVGAGGSSSLSLDGFAVVRAPLCGVYVGESEGELESVAR